MDKQEYLDQISATNRPAKSKDFSKVLKSKYFMWGMIAVAALILIVVLGAVIRGSRSNVKEKVFTLKQRIDNDLVVMNSYQRNLKSSIIRSDSASLYSVLSITSSNLSAYAQEEYKGKNNTPAKVLSAETLEELTLEKDGLEADLYDAKINGNLDRIYIHKLIYEISVLMSQEENIIKSSKDETLDNILTSSYNSLENLYNKINDFSEAKQ